MLLVMATGTGKTYTAFQIVYRLLQSGMKRKILYLADRNILVDQSIQQDFAPLEKVIHKINVGKDDPSTITSHQVYFSLYQQLVGDEGEESARKHAISYDNRRKRSPYRRVCPNILQGKAVRSWLDLGHALLHRNLFLYLINWGLSVCSNFNLKPVGANCVRPKYRYEFDLAGEHSSPLRRLIIPINQNLKISLYNFWATMLTYEE